MTKMKILIDADDVLADFGAHAREVAASVVPRPVDWSKVYHYDLFTALTDEEDRACWEEMKKPGWVRTMPVVPGAQHVVWQLRTMAEVVVLTSPPHDCPNWVPERYEWLNRHFSFDSDHVIFARGKYHVAGDILIDDNPKHLAKWFERHQKGVPIARAVPAAREIPHEKGVWVARSWQQLLTYVEREFRTRTWG